MSATINVNGVKRNKMSKPLQKIPRSQLQSVTFMLWQQQGGKCAICGKTIDVTVRGRTSDYVVDHCHESGEIRGVLHRSCNAAEGKVTNAAGRWGAKSTKYSEVIPFLRQLVDYLERSQAKGTGMMYPDHKTDEQKKEAALLKRRKEYAKKRAAEIQRNAKR